MAKMLSPDGQWRTDDTEALRLSNAQVARNVLDGTYSQPQLQPPPPAVLPPTPVAPQVPSLGGVSAELGRLANQTRATTDNATKAYGAAYGIADDADKLKRESIRMAEASGLAQAEAERVLTEKRNENLANEAAAAQQKADADNKEIQDRIGFLDNAYSAKDKATGEFDPNRIMSVPKNRIIAGASLFLGAIGSAMLGQESQIPGMLDRLIERDIQAQQEKIRIAGDKVGDEAKRLGMARDIAGDNVAANKMREVKIIEQYQRGLESISANYKDENLKARAAEAYGALDAEKSKRLTEVTDNITKTVLSGIGTQASITGTRGDLAIKAAAADAVGNKPIGNHVPDPGKQQNPGAAQKAADEMGPIVATARELAAIKANKNATPADSDRADMLEDQLKELAKKAQLGEVDTDNPAAIASNAQLVLDQRMTASGYMSPTRSFAETRGTRVR